MGASVLCTAHKIWSFPCGVSEEQLARHCTAHFEPKRERERERERQDMLLTPIV